MLSQILPTREWRRRVCRASCTRLLCVCLSEAGASIDLGICRNRQQGWEVRVYGVWVEVSNVLNPVPHGCQRMPVIPFTQSYVSKLLRRFTIYFFSTFFLFSLLCFLLLFYSFCSLPSSSPFFFYLSLPLSVSISLSFLLSVSVSLSLSVCVVCILFSLFLCLSPSFSLALSLL